MKDMLFAALALVAAVGAIFSFVKYTGNGETMYIVIAVICIVATVGLGGVFLSGRVNKTEDIHITE